MQKSTADLIKITEGFYYDIQCVLGEGCFGKVYKGFWSCKNKVIAVKFVKNAGYNEREIETLKILSTLTHPSIMDFYGFEVVEEGVYLFMEFLPNGTLTPMIKNGIEEDVILRIFRQLLEGMAYINAKGQMHRDLKPDNILLGENNQVKICDFGLARESGDDIRTTAQQGTPLYSAPEVYCNKEENYNQKVDVWSAGLILYEMLSGATAFKHIIGFNDLHRQWGQFRKGKMFAYDSKLHPQWEYFTNMMLTYNPAKRPTFNDVLDKLKMVESRMLEEIKFKRNNPGADLSEMQGNEKVKRVHRYLQHFLYKAEALLEVTRSFKMHDFHHIKNSVKYLLMFLTMTRYLCRMKGMAKNLRYKQITLPDGEDVGDDDNDVEVIVLLDKFRNICENHYAHYEDRLRNEILMKIFKEYANRKEDKDLYKKVEKVFVMAVEVKNNCYDLEEDYEEGYHYLVQHELVLQSKNSVKKMNLEDLRAYQSLVLADNIDKVFPEEAWLKGKSPKDTIADIKDSPADKIQQFILQYSH